MDFTLKTYRNLLEAIQKAGYATQTFEEFIQKPKDKVIVLRHDVDRLPKNARLMAEIENEFKIKSSYYFRVIASVYKESIIMECAKLGHEVSYHYEDMTICKGDIDESFRHFKKYLQRFRDFYPAKTVCMHGSPLTKWDNRDIWKKYNYKDLGIIAEPYFDVDYNKVLYITDTGRKWNNVSISIRDKVKTNYNYSFLSTFDLIQKIRKNQLPNQIIINHHILA